MRTMLIGIACLSLLHAEGRRWKLHPALDDAVERIKIGELTSVVLPEPVIGTSDEQARQDYLKAQRAHDKEGIQELMDAAKIAVLSPGTEVRVLERNEADLDKLMDTVLVDAWADAEAAAALALEAARMSDRLDAAAASPAELSAESAVMGAAARLFATA